MAQFDLENLTLVGEGGLLPVEADDEITRKLLMLIEGECEGPGPSRPTSVTMTLRCTVGVVLQDDVRLPGYIQHIKYMTTA